MPCRSLGDILADLSRNACAGALFLRAPPPEPYPGYNRNAAARLHGWAALEREDDNPAAADALELAAIRLEGFPR